MLRYIIGITLITAGLILIRALSNGKILKKHQYALWLIIPAFMILFPLVKFVIPEALEKASAEGGFVHEEHPRRFYKGYYRFRE